MSIITLPCTQNQRALERHCDTQRLTMHLLLTDAAGHKNTQ